MKGYTINLEQETIANTDYRRVLYTTHRMQLVLMNLESGEEIGEEVHGLDQFIRIDQGEAEFILDGESTTLGDGGACIIPAGVRHNVINTGSEPLKLYSIYTPPEHRHDVVQSTKAEESEEHFDGHTS